MKKIIIILFVCLFLQSCQKNKVELILLGTVHQPVENFNPDSLYTILTKIDPDLILFEVDSSFFTQDFKFKKNWNSNENIAAVKYMAAHDVKVRPYDFTGRNEYRIKIGSRPTDGKAFKMLDSLYRSKSLGPKDERHYWEFLQVDDRLNSFAYQGAKAFNSLRTDSVAEKRQHLHYNALGKIMDGYEMFHNTYHTKDDGERISFAEGYRLAGDFWNLRNQAMARHILHFIEHEEGKRIVVLNGYFHRYYLNSLLRPEQQGKNFVIKEFYEY